MKSKDRLQTLINCLLIESCGKNVLCEALEFIAGLNAKEIDRNLLKIDELFFICAQKLNHESINDREVVDKIENAFENIRYIDKKNDDVNCITINFLSQIKDITLNDYNPTSKIMACYEKICDNLDKIHFLFQIKKDGKLLFPIGKLLNYVISDEKFFSENLDIISLNTLLLALEIFDSKASIRKKIDIIIDKCSLECLKFLQNTEVKKVGGDYGWKENFKKNGSLTLLIPYNGSFKVYVRHEKREYFDKPVLDDLSLKQELNSRKSVIAYYYIWEPSKRIEIENIQNLIKTSDILLLQNLCRILFEEEKMNVFLENSFIKMGSEIRTTNFFVGNDKYIISEKQCFKADREKLIKYFLKPYSLLRIGHNFDFVLLGAIFKLFGYNSTQLDDVFKVLISKPENIQDCILKVWIENESDVNKIKDLQNDYFESIRYALKKRTILEQSFEDILWLPYKFPLEAIELYAEKKFGVNLGKKIIRISVMDGFEDVEYKTQDGKIIDSKAIIFKDCEKITAGDFFVVCEEGVHKFNFDSSVDILCKLKERIEDENEKLISLKLFESIEESQIKNVIDKMKLQQDALIANTGYSDFESIAYLRLLNHLLYCNIPRGREWMCFYELLDQHQTISFTSLSHDISEYNRSGVFIVPKECRNTDNAMVSILDKYGRNEARRNRDYFNRNISFNKLLKKYCLEGSEVITKVVILFDTLQSGTSTIDILKAYFDKTTDSKSTEKICKFYDRTEITLDKIIKKNNASLEILSLYGSKEGKEKVDAYIKSSKNTLKQAKEILVKHKIKNKANKAFIEKMEKLYPKEDRDDSDDLPIEEGKYLIIREFNQPKRNMFPNKLLDPACIASIFVKKPEFEAN